MSPVQRINALCLAARARFRTAPFFCAEWEGSCYVSMLPVTTFRHHTPGATFVTISDRRWRYRSDRQGD